MKRVSAGRLSLCSLALLSACSGPAPLFNANHSAPQLGSLMQGPARAVENQVQAERLSGFVAVLSGQQAGRNATVIAERGSSEGREQTRAYLTQSLQSMGYAVERQDYRRNGSNLFVRLMADTPTDEYIVIGAHLDSVRNAGADDNASGSAAVLEAAAVFKGLSGRKVNLILAWFDEEEIGLVGSQALAQAFRKQGLKISSMHNIDMLGWDGDGDRAIEVAQPDGNLWDYYQMVNRSHGFNLPLERSNTGQSDHESFHRAGFDSVCLSEEYTSGDLTPYYHRRGDVFATVNLDYLTRSTRFILAVVGDLVQGVPAPVQIQAVPHENFPARQRHTHRTYDEAAAHLDAPQE